MTPFLPGVVCFRYWSCSYWWSWATDREGLGSNHTARAAAKPSRIYADSNNSKQRAWFICTTIWVRTYMEEVPIASIYPKYISSPNLAWQSTMWVQ